MILITIIIDINNIFKDIIQKQKALQKKPKELFLKLSTMHHIHLKTAITGTVYKSMLNQARRFSLS